MLFTVFFAQSGHVISLNKKDLNDVTASPFLVPFSQLPAAKKPTENEAAVTSLRSFLFGDDFSR